MAESGFHQKYAVTGLEGWKLRGLGGGLVGCCSGGGVRSFSPLFIYVFCLPYFVYKLKDGGSDTVLAKFNYKR